MAVRTALDASRGRLARQFLAESIPLALLGALGGLALAYWGFSWLLALGPASLSYPREVGLSPTLFAFLTALSILICDALGWACSHSAARVSLSRSLGDPTRSTVPGNRYRLRSALVVGQVAVSVVLLVGAGLLIKSLANLMQVDPGMRLENRLTLRLALPCHKPITTSQPRFISLLMALFSGIALLQGVAGLYGVIAHSVRHRTREYGLRMALGANPSRLYGSVLKNGLSLVLLGLIIGLMGAAALAPLAESLLYEVSTLDFRSYSIAAALLVGTAILACSVPAARAMRVDPMVTLRQD